MTEVARLLTAARKAHDAKKRAAGTVQTDGKTSTPDYQTAEAHIREALSLRQEAHDLDPNHIDPAWQADQTANRGVSHADLCAWFEKYLASVAPKEPLSIEEIGAAVGAPPNVDKLTTAAYALLLLESGWIQPADVPPELLNSGAFMRFRHRVEPSVSPVS